jgi:hypothetical protein
VTAQDLRLNIRKNIIQATILTEYARQKLSLFPKYHEKYGAKLLYIFVHKEGVNFRKLTLKLFTVDAVNTKLFGFRDCSGTRKIDNKMLTFHGTYCWFHVTVNSRTISTVVRWKRH